MYIETNHMILTGSHSKKKLVGQSCRKNESSQKGRKNKTQINPGVYTLNQYGVLEFICKSYVMTTMNQS